MAITKERKRETIRSVARHEKDGGSPEVQIAMLTDRIKELNKHIQAFKKDLHSKHGLLLMISKRNRLLKFLKRDKPEKYQEILTKFDLRK